MYTRHVLLFATLAAATLAQEVQVTGAVKTPVTLRASELAKMPRATVETKSEGNAIRYEGVWLHEVLKRAGAPEPRGKALATYVLATGSDGYQALYSIAELDPAFTDNQVLLADREGGKPLTGAQGPFRLVAPKDKRGARSVRMLTKIEVVSLRQ